TAAVIEHRDAQLECAEQLKLGHAAQGDRGTAGIAAQQGLPVHAVPDEPHPFMLRVALPMTIESGGTSLVTMLPAAMMLRAPTVTPLRMVTLKPIQASSSMRMPAAATPSRSRGWPLVAMATNCRWRSDGSRG